MICRGSSVTTASGESVQRPADHLRICSPGAAGFAINSSLGDAQVAG
jgi:hypothetical protein